MVDGPTNEAMVESNIETTKKVFDVYNMWLSNEKVLGLSFTLVDIHNLPYLHYVENVVGKGHMLTSRKHVNTWFQLISYGRSGLYI